MKKFIVMNPVIAVLWAIWCHLDYFVFGNLTPFLNQTVSLFIALSIYQGHLFEKYDRSRIIRQFSDYVRVPSSSPSSEEEQEREYINNTSGSSVQRERQQERQRRWDRNIRRFIQQMQRIQQPNHLSEREMQFMAENSHAAAASSPPYSTYNGADIAASSLPFETGAGIVGYNIRVARNAAVTVTENTTTAASASSSTSNDSSGSSSRFATFINNTVTGAVNAALSSSSLSSSRSALAHNTHLSPQVLRPTTIVHRNFSYTATTATTATTNNDHHGSAASSQNNARDIIIRFANFADLYISEVFSLDVALMEIFFFRYGEFKERIYNLDRHIVHCEKEKLQKKQQQQPNGSGDNKNDKQDLQQQRQTSPFSFYQAKCNNKEEEDDCPICMEPIIYANQRMVQPCCGKVLHITCSVMTHTSVGSNCPMCRDFGGDIMRRMTMDLTMRRTWKILFMMIREISQIENCYRWMKTVDSNLFSDFYCTRYCTLQTMAIERSLKKMDRILGKGIWDFIENKILLQKKFYQVAERQGGMHMRDIMIRMQKHGHVNVTDQDDTQTSPSSSSKDGPWQWSYQDIKWKARRVSPLDYPLCTTPLSISSLFSLGQHEIRNDNTVY